MIPGYLYFSSYIGQKIHLGISGSVAAYKALDLCRMLRRTQITVSATLTASGKEFVTPLSFRACGADPVYDQMFKNLDLPFSHLEPGQNTSLLAVVPATANTLAKIAHGLADDLLFCQILSFPGPLLVAPAMNPNLWHAQPTQENLKTIRNRGGYVVEPDYGLVACGDEGSGKLASLMEIYFACLKLLSSHSLENKKILITLGPTQESWDPVRYWTNHSSGKMGAALAVAAWLLGADVHCVCGPSNVWLPQGVTMYPVRSALEMYQKTLEIWPECHIACLSAAVCDFRPAETSHSKFKKDTCSDLGLSIEFETNPDILKQLGKKKESWQRLIGFAAETGSEYISRAQAKLDSKNLDLLVVNRVDLEESGFGADMNKVVFLSKSKQQNLPEMNKADVAWQIWDWILKELD